MKFDYILFKETKMIRFRVTLFEDPAYHSLIEKIMFNRTSLLKEFVKADKNKNGWLFLKILPFK
jgi:hypothetical protein